MKGCDEFSEKSKGRVLEKKVFQVFPDTPVILSQSIIFLTNTYKNIKIGVFFFSLLQSMVDIFYPDFRTICRCCFWIISFFSSPSEFVKND